MGASVAAAPWTDSKDRARGRFFLALVGDATRFVYQTEHREPTYIQVPFFTFPIVIRPNSLSFLLALDKRQIIKTREPIRPQRRQAQTNKHKRVKKHRPSTTKTLSGPDINTLASAATCTVPSARPLPRQPSHPSAIARVSFPESRTSCLRSWAALTPTCNSSPRSMPMMRFEDSRIIPPVVCVLFSFAVGLF